MATTTPSALQTETAADWVFFVLGGVAATWLSWVLLRESFTFGWWQLLFAVVFWVLVAYLLLPRLHRILTRIYVPDYFIGRARTSDGLLGDPVNLALLGSEAEVHEAMVAAGWTRADDLSVRTGLRIVRSTLLRRSYLEAPVSPLLLFGRKQDFAYQQEVDGSPGKRHHVRFWRCPDDWKLPGGFRVDWLAAGTYDRSVGLSLFTLQVTHKIAPDTDTERDHIVTTVREARPEIVVHNLEDFSTGYHARNGGGDAIVTDGDLPVLDLTPMAVDAADAALPTDSRDRRPAPTAVGAALTLLSGLSSIASGLLAMLGAPALADELDPELHDVATTAIAVVGGLSVAIGVVIAITAWRVFLGSPRARILVLSLSVLSIAGLILSSQLDSAENSISANLPTVALNVLVLLALSSERARIYAHRRRKAPKRISGLPGDVARF